MSHKYVQLPGKTLSFCAETSIYEQAFRRNFLYIRGKIGLTLCFLLPSLFNAPDELGKLQEICHAKGGATGSKDDTGIRGSKARPGCWQSSHVARGIVKSDAIFSPIVPVAEDLKLLAAQGMKRVGDRENSFRQRGRRCS
jgi:hypothetical protein